MNAVACNFTPDSSFPSQHYLKLSRNIFYGHGFPHFSMAGQFKWTLYKLTLMFLNLCVIEASGPKPKILVDCNAAIPNSLYLRYSFEDKGSWEILCEIGKFIIFTFWFRYSSVFLLFTCDKQKYGVFRCYLYFETFHFPMS